MHYSIALHSEKGTRQTNQDRVAYSENKNGIFMVVADGLGGYTGGELAAQTVVDSLIRSFDELGDSKVDDPAAFIVLSMNYAHSLIIREARARGLNPSEPRTTCVACLVQDGYAYWGHVGDSRLYLFNDGELLARTIDHSTTDHMHQNGAVDEQVQRLSSGQLFRCLGGNRRPVVTLGPETHLGTGDTILLCTDGVWRAFKERKLAKVVQMEMIEDSVDDLLSHAQRYFRHDCDNLTALMFRWNDNPTTEKPLLNVNAPELDQANLSNPGRPRVSIPNLPNNVEQKQASEEFSSMIDEIESLVKELDTVYEKKRGDKKTKH